MNNMLQGFRAAMFDTAGGEESYESVLQRVQNSVAAQLTSAVETISESDLKDLIARDIMDKHITCAQTASFEELTNHIYHDMAGLSFISRENLFNREGFEEININAWDAVEVITSEGRKNTGFSFLSPEHAIDIITRMFRKTSTPFDNAHPRATADIGGGVRITASKMPIVDADIAITASIRKVNLKVAQLDKLVSVGTATQKMIEFLLLCLNHGASMCISGETGAGKTTLAGSLLAVVSEHARTYTIEEGAREWQMVKRDENGKMLNSVIHTRTRINEQDPSQSIDQEALVKDALRYDPDIIAPGEIRGREAFETMGAANTGHTVITTVHSNNTLSTPERIITLAKKAYDMSDATLYSMAARAFPILVHCEKLRDGKRRITEIREVTDYEHGELQSHILFQFNILDNIADSENPDIITDVAGEFIQLAPISEKLAQVLLRKGARRSQIEPYLTVEKPAAKPKATRRKKTTAQKEAVAADEPAGKPKAARRKTKAAITAAAETGDGECA